MSLLKNWVSKKQEESDSSYEQDNVDDSSSYIDFEEHLDPELIIPELNPKAPYCESDSTLTNKENSENNDTKNNQKNEEISSTKPSTKIIETKNDGQSIKTERENNYKNPYTEKKMYFQRCDDDYPTTLKFFWYLSEEDYQKTCCCISGLFISQLQCCFGNLCSPERKENLKKYFTSITFIITVIDVFVYLLLICLDTSSLDGLLKPSPTLLYKAGAYIYQRWYGMFTYSFLHKNWIHLLINLVLFNNIGIMVEGMPGKKLYISAYLALNYFGWFYGVFYFNKNICIAGNSPIYFGFLGFYMIESIFTCLLRSDRKKEKIDSIVICIFITLLLIGFCLIDRCSAFSTIATFISGFLLGLCCQIKEIWPFILYCIIYFIPFFLPWVVLLI